MYFKLLGIQYGKNLDIENKVYLKGAGQIIIGDNLRFTSGDCINPVCRNIRGVLYTMTQESRIVIGDNVGISSSCLWAKELIRIGNNVLIGGDCILMDNDCHPHDYHQRQREYIFENGREVYYEKILSSPIIIENDVWVGARCQILKGVHIGARTIIASGSIVTKDIPSDCLAGGVPCKIIKSLNEN